MTKIDKGNNLFYKNKRVGEIVYDYPFYKIMMNGKMYERCYSQTKAKKIARILLNDFAFTERALAA